MKTALVRFSHSPKKYSGVDHYSKQIVQISVLKLAIKKASDSSGIAVNKV